METSLMSMWQVRDLWHLSPTGSSPYVLTVYIALLWTCRAFLGPRAMDDGLGMGTVSEPELGRRTLAIVLTERDEARGLVLGGIVTVVETVFTVVPYIVQPQQ